jgi:hypothetical protein
MYNDIMYNLYNIDTGKQIRADNISSYTADKRNNILSELKIRES